MNFFLVNLKIFILHIQSACKTAYLVYMYADPFLWNTCVYVLQQFIILYILSPQSEKTTQTTTKLEVES